MELKDFLMLLSGIGAITAISWLWEFFNLFPNMDAKQKKLTLFGFSALVAVGALLIRTYVPLEVLDQVAPYFITISAIFVNLFVGDIFHAATK